MSSVDPSAAAQLSQLSDAQRALNVLLYTALEQPQVDVTSSWHTSSDEAPIAWSRDVYRRRDAVNDVTPSDTPLVAKPLQSRVRRHSSSVHVSSVETSRPSSRAGGERFFLSLTALPAPLPRPSAAPSAPPSAPPSHVHALAWDDAWDDCLTHAVARVAAAGDVARLLESYHVQRPPCTLPLGERSTPTLTGAELGPRSESQYSASVRMDMLRLQHVPAAQRAQLEQELKSITSRSELETILAMPMRRVADLDWKRVAHGGFMPVACNASPLDCKVRWISHVLPQLRVNGAVKVVKRLGRPPLSWKRSNVKWSRDMDDALQRKVAQLEPVGVQWHDVATSIGPSLAACDVIARHVALSDACTSTWTVEEDDALRRAVALYGVKDWSSVREELPRLRTSVQVARRWAQLTSTGTVGWSHEQELELRCLRRMFQSDWSSMAAYMPTRTAQALAERWSNVLDVDLNSEAFTAEEDERLKSLVVAHGKVSWARLTKEFQGRTDSALRRRWQVLQRGGGDAPASAAGAKRRRRAGAAMEEDDDDEPPARRKRGRRAAFAAADEEAEDGASECDDDIDDEH